MAERNVGDELICGATRGLVSQFNRQVRRRDVSLTLLYRLGGAEGVSTGNLVLRCRFRLSVFGSDEAKRLASAAGSE